MSLCAGNVISVHEGDVYKRQLLDYRRYIDPDDWEMTMMIPMTEFDGNESLNIATYQNP